MEKVQQNHPVILNVQDVKKYFPIKAGLLRRHVGNVKAVDGVTFQLFRGETLGLVGESGCGKTTLGRLIAGAHSATAGNVQLFAESGEPMEIKSLHGQKLKDYLCRVQLIFQDPYSSLNPRRTVMQILEEPLICLTSMSHEERRARVLDLLETVGLDRRHAERYPHAFSGGQRQRIGIARALAINPSLIVCDEAVSALDVSVRGQIINLLMDLREHLGLSYLFVSHDLGVVRHISNRIAVMYVGKLVEIANSNMLFTKPKHPYTEALLSAVPRADPTRPIEAMILEGDVPDPANPPSGCYFHPRCRYATDICKQQEPALRKVDDEHYSACHLADELQLRGAA